MTAVCSTCVCYMQTRARACSHLPWPSFACLHVYMHARACSRHPWPCGCSAEREQARPSDHRGGDGREQSKEDALRCRIFIREQDGAREDVIGSPPHHRSHKRCLIRTVYKLLSRASCPFVHTFVYRPLAHGVLEQSCCFSWPEIARFCRYGIKTFPVGSIVVDMTQPLHTNVSFL